MTDSELKSGGFTVPADWVRQMIEILQPAPRTLARLMSAADLHWRDLAEPGRPISQRQEVAFLMGLSRHMGHPYLPAELGLRMSGRTSTVVSYILHSSRNLGEAMVNTSRLLPLTRPGALVRFRKVADGGSWRLDNRDPWVREAAPYQEYVTSVILAAFRTATGRQVLPLRIGLRAPSARHVHRLACLWGCPVSAEEGGHFLDFDAETMAQPLVAGDAHLLSHLQKYGEILLRDRPPEEPDMMLHVERAILDRLSNGVMPAAEVAAGMGISARTLNRRLQAHGETYRGLVDKVRHRKALLLLRDPSLSLAEVTFLLGYSEQSGFAHAFRRWTGMAPGAYRAAALTPAPQQAAGDGRP